MYVTKLLMQIANDIKTIAKNVKRLEPKTKVVVREINYFEDLGKKTRGKGNSQYILTAAFHNPKVIIIARDIQECKRLEETFVAKFPGSAKPLFLSVDEYERRPVPNIPVMIDMSVFSVKSTPRYDFHGQF